MKIQFIVYLVTIFFPLTLTEETPLQEFTSGNNLFTASVYKELSKNAEGNFLVSPFSVETVLALLHFGAKEETAEEIRQSLLLPKTPDKIAEAIKSLQPSLRQNEFYALRSANKIYIKEGFVIKDDFKKVAIDVFGSDLEEINFIQKDEAIKVINDWIEGRTEHKIKNLIGQDHINDRTRTILVNALYFKGNWSDAFAKYATFKEDFYKNGKDVALVDMMHDTSSRKYLENKELDAKLIELEFEGDDITMTIVLPNEKDGLNKLESNLEQILKIQKSQYTSESVRLILPKFKIESQIDFGKILQELGVKKAFKDEEADLSGIAGKKGDLVVDKVVQKTFIDVNEEGVEAAAATFAAVGVPLSGFIPIAPPKEFRADHPFIFIIKYKDVIMFAGRVVDPSQ